MIISIIAEKIFDKTHNSSSNKILNKVGKEISFLNTAKVIFYKHRAYSILSGEIEILLSKVRYKIRPVTLTIIIQYGTGSSCQCYYKKQEILRGFKYMFQILKREVKLSQFQMHDILRNP